MRARPPVVVIAPDSFKGSIAAAGASFGHRRRSAPRLAGADLRLCPMADGGEGTLDAILSRGGQRLTARVAGASGETVEADYGIAGEGRTAIIEAAQIVGLADARGTAVDVERRSSRGIGELMLTLLGGGPRELMIGLGGTSTNDGGAGMLAALGVQPPRRERTRGRCDAQGLATLARVDAGGLDPRLRETKITIMSDVDNVLTGPAGPPRSSDRRKACGPNASARSTRRFRGLRRWSKTRWESALRDRPGAGAAGGLGFALQLLGGETRSGAEVVANLIGLDAALRGADWADHRRRPQRRSNAFGKDAVHGRGPGGESDVPATLISGAVDREALPLLARTFAGCFSIADGPASLQECIAQRAATARQSRRASRASSPLCRAPGRSPARPDSRWPCRRASRIAPSDCFSATRPSCDRAATSRSPEKRTGSRSAASCTARRESCPT